MSGYRVVSGDCIQELEEDVSKLLAEGFLPIGGVAILRSTWTNERKGYEESEVRFYQAMIKSSLFRRVLQAGATTLMSKEER